jgi:copper chaperone NosL
LSLVVACAPGQPERIAFDADVCTYCRMLISDGRFAATIVTVHGRTLKFDSIECLVAYYRQAAAAHDVASVWVSDVRHPGTLIDATTARFIDAGEVRAPMGAGRGWAAVASTRDAAALGVIDSSAIKRWIDLQ